MEPLSVSDADINEARRDTVIIGVKRAERWIRRLQQQGIRAARVQRTPRLATYRLPPAVSTHSARYERAGQPVQFSPSV